MLLLLRMGNKEWLKVQGEGQLQVMINFYQLLLPLYPSGLLYYFTNFVDIIFFWSDDQANTLRRSSAYMKMFGTSYTCNEMAAITTLDTIEFSWKTPNVLLHL